MVHIEMIVYNSPVAVLHHLYSSIYKQKKTDDDSFHLALVESKHT